MVEGDILRRRALLKSIGAASTVTFAGCSGQGSQTEDGSSGSSGSSSSSGGGGSSGGDTATKEQLNYPDKDITTVVPFSSGGGMDYFARATAPYWSKYLPNDVNVNVVNKPGGGGQLATRQVYNAKPNGYTMEIFDPFSALAVQVGQNAEFDYRKMDHIGAITQTPPGLNIRKGLNISSWDEFAKGVQSGKYTAATAGKGGGSHLATLLFGEMTGEWKPEDVNFVHYKGSSEMVSGMQRKNADFIFLAGATSFARFAIGVDNVEAWVLFSSPESVPKLIADQTKMYLEDISISKGVQEWAKLYGFQRTFSNPPGTPEKVLKLQRNALMKIANDEKFNSKIKEDSRPIMNPATASEMNISKVNQRIYEKMNSEPIKSVLQNA